MSFKRLSLHFMFLNCQEKTKHSYMRKDPGLLQMLGLSGTCGCHLEFEVPSDGFYLSPVLLFAHSAPAIPICFLMLDNAKLVSAPSLSRVYFFLRLFFSCGSQG